MNTLLCLVIAGLLVVFWASAHAVHDMRLEIRALRMLCVRRGIARFRREDGGFEPISADDPIERILQNARRG